MQGVRVAPLLRGPDCGHLKPSSFSAVLPLSGRTWNREQTSGQVRQALGWVLLQTARGIRRLHHVSREWSTCLGSTMHINNGTAAVKYFSFGYFLEERIRKKTEKRERKKKLIICVVYAPWRAILEKSASNTSVVVCYWLPGERVYWTVA